jgi:PAS domain S-box-containing protein
MKIAKKIILSFVALAIIFADMSGIAIYLIAKGGFKKFTRNNLIAISTSRTGHIETYLNMLEISVGQFSKSVVLENLLKTSTAEGPGHAKIFEDAMRRLKRTKEANSSIAEFLLLDKTGNVLASSNEGSIGLDKSREEYFLGGQKRIYIEDIHYSEGHRKELLIAISAPIVDSQTGEFLGEIAAWTRLDELNKIVTERSGLGDTGEIYILNRHGYMITPSRFREDVVLKQKVDTEGARQARLHESNKNPSGITKKAYIYPDYRGIQVLGAYELIPRMQWVVLTEADVKETFAPLARLRLVIFLVIFFVPLAVWIAGGIIAKLITGPLLKLSEGTEIIGSGNLDYKIGTDAKDEVGQLSRAFERMLSNLKKTTTSIDGLNQEIIQRKKVEEALQESKARLDLALRSSGMGVWRWDIEENKRYFDDQASRLLGLKPHASGRDEEEFFKVVHPEDRPLVKARLDRTIKQNIAYEVDYRVVWPDKSIHYLSARGRLLHDASGRPMRISGVIWDISERKRAEEIAKENLYFLQLLIDAMPSPVFFKDAGGVYLGCNKAFEKYLGLPRDKIIGKSVYDISPREFADKYHEKDMFLVQHPGTQTYEALVRYADGSTHDVIFNKATFTNVNGDVAGIVGIISDITERKKNEEELKQAYKELKNTQNQLTQASKMAAIGQLAGGVAHEINNPLTGVLNNVQLVKMLADKAKEFKIEEFRDILSTIEESALRCKRITNALLDFAHASKGEFQPVSLNLLIDRVLEIISTELKLVSVTVVKELQPDLPVVNGDSQLLQQVVLGLVANAKWAIDKKPGHGGGIITIKTYQDPQTKSAVVMVADNGIGIPQENLVRIFEPFFTTKEVGEGTGLGLALVYNIIKNHDGSVTLESQVNVGTTVKIDLPVKTV